MPGWMACATVSSTAGRARYEGGKRGRRCETGRVHECDWRPSSTHKPTLEKIAIHPRRCPLPLPGAGSARRSACQEYLNPAMNPQPIFINGRFLVQPVSGVQRYAREVVLALDGLLAAGEIDCDRYAFEIVVPAGAGNLPSLEHITIRSSGSLRGQAWEQFVLPVISRGGWLLSLCNVGPLFKPRHIVTIHDASVFAFPEAYSTGFRSWYQLALPILTHTAARIITDSRFSEGELVRYCKPSPGKVAVVHLGVDH